MNRQCLLILSNYKYRLPENLQTIDNHAVFLLLIYLHFEGIKSIILNRFECKLITK